MMIVKKRLRNDYLFLAAALLTFSLAIFFHFKSPYPDIVISKQQTATNINRYFLKVFSIGNKRLVSSMIWIQTLIESDVEHYDKKDKNNWLFLRFRTIAELDELFYQNYNWGGLYLSIVKDDLVGAAEIYELGLIKYPDDYQLNYNAGFNYFFEMDDLASALPKLKKILTNPNTSTVSRSIVNKILFEKTKDYDLVLDYLNQNLGLVKEETFRSKILADIYAVKAERDLSCLNEEKQDCEKLDSDGNPYLYKNGRWLAAKVFSEYRLKKKSDNKKQ